MNVTDEPQSPLTMEFTPEPAFENDPSLPIVAIEPSFQKDGRIFVAVHPFGKRVGLHLLPAEVTRIRNHLTKLLMEKPEDEEPPATPHPDWQDRIEAAAQRARAAEKPPKKPRKPLLGHFRLEWQIGRFVLVIGTSRDE